MKVLITNRIPKKVLNAFTSFFDVDYHDDLSFMTKEEIIERGRDAEILLVPLSQKIDGSIMEKLKSLKLILNYGAGFDNIDLEGATKGGIIVTNAPAKGSTVATAELTLGLMIDLCRHITKRSADCYNGDFKGWKPSYALGESLCGKRLGILGLGRIGEEVARKAEAFDMEIVYWNRSERDVDYEALSFEELIKTSDIITLHTAFHEELHHLIDGKAFSMMKKDAYLINASRGPIVSEKALINALKSGEIKGAALDVYEFEPQISEELKTLDNLLLSPHLGNATREAREEMGMMAFENAKAYLEGREIPYRVN
ncbi:MAG: NAD(P)-dependent oxidoreductase [Tissierellia bacterium]|nr:NAD(P)-dependent oxidoreductase [Tissierellia bacterium]